VDLDSLIDNLLPSRAHRVRSVRPSHDGRIRILTPRLLLPSASGSDHLEGVQLSLQLYLLSRLRS